MNTGKMFKSIKYQALIYIVVFMITLVLFLWLFQTIFLSVFYERYQIKTINNIALEIYNTSSSDLDTTLTNIVYNNNVCIELLDKDGKGKGYNLLSSACLLGRENSDIEKYKNTIIESGEDLKGIKLVNPDYDSNAILYGIKVGGKYVFVFSMLENVDKTTSLLNGQMVYIIIITIIIAILIAFFLANKISLPIEKITKQSRKMANGDYNVEFSKNGIKEIDELADTLTYLEKEVSKTDEFRRDLMANVSHDLKTPLTMIKAYAEMVRDISYNNPEKRNEHLNIIINETDRLNVLVNDILVLSKIQATEEELQIEEFDLIKEIKEIVSKYTIIKETENYEIICTMPKKAMVHADKKKINQVIYNLINNAINYTGKDNKVTINIKEEKNAYLVEIIDTGKGISMEDLKHIWDRYYKKERNHKRNVVGTGLGLSIVKNILESHNFKYGVDSKIKKGTKFYFKICK